MENETVLTGLDKVIIPLGITTPVWLPCLNMWLATLVGFATLIYTFIKIADAVFRWRHNWMKRKHEEKMFKK